MATFVMLGKVVSSKLKDWITNQHALKAWGGGERLKVEEATWTKEAVDAVKAKSMWDRGFNDTRETCVEDTDTITEWGFVNCDVTLDAAVVGI